MCCSWLALTHCAAPNSYFTPTQAVRPIQVGSHVVKPRIILVTPNLYANTIDFGRAHPKQSLWYLNDYSYQIGPGDVLSLTVWGHPEITGATIANGNLNSAQTSDILVNHSGEFYFPFVGTIHAAGLSVDEVRATLIKKMKPYIRNPQALVAVKNYRSQTVHLLTTSGVNSIVPLTDQPLSLLTAVSASPGQENDTSHIFVIRGSGLHPTLFMLNAKSPGNLLIADKFKLYPNDIVYIPIDGEANWQAIASRLVNSAAPIVTASTMIDQLRK